MTPQQMRALAASLDGYTHLDELTEAAVWKYVAKSAFALRTAADQLEAVEREAREWIAAPADENAPARVAGEVFLAILTADTAPQEGRDD